MTAPRKTERRMAKIWGDYTFKLMLWRRMTPKASVLAFRASDSLCLIRHYYGDPHECRLVGTIIRRNAPVGYPGAAFLSERLV